MDDFLIAGMPEAMQWLSKKVNARFTAGAEIHAPDQIRLNGACIDQAKDYSIRVSMEEFAKQIKRLDIDRPRRKQAEASATPGEIKQHQSLAGKMSWLGHAAAPACAFAASCMQQCLGDLRVKHLSQANGLLTEAQRAAPVITYGKPAHAESVTYCVFADAAFPKISGSPCGQAGMVAGLALGDGPNAAFHSLSWASHKQTRACRSSSSAEMLPIAEAEETGGGLKLALEKIASKTIPLELNVDSQSLLNAITSQKPSADFRIRQAAQASRDSYERREIATMRWIAGKANPADAIAKRSAATSKLLSDMMRRGVLSVGFTTGLATPKQDPPLINPK